MDRERIERAVRRIESALGRIAAVADTDRASSPATGGQEDRHLRAAVTDALEELDDLIGKLER